jgi:hypothetical protein
LKLSRINQSIKNLKNFFPLPVMLEFFHIPAES